MRMRMTSFLLVTTSNSLLLLDGGSGSGWRIDSGKEHYYGIARGMGVFYVGNRYRSNASAVPNPSFSTHR